MNRQDIKYGLKFKAIDNDVDWWVLGTVDLPDGDYTIVATDWDTDSEDNGHLESFDQGTHAIECFLPHEIKIAPYIPKVGDTGKISRNSQKVWRVEAVVGTSYVVLRELAGKFLQIETNNFKAMSLEQFKFI